MKSLIHQLQLLSASYRKRNREYNKEAKEQRRNGDKLNANRYEGIATASRWIAEDLEKLLSEIY